MRPTKLPKARPTPCAVALLVIMTVLASCSSATGADRPVTGAAAGEAKAAQQAVDAGLKDPTEISVTTPLASAPPKGKTMVWLQCEFPECANEGKGLAAAAEAVGWTLRTIPFQSANPSTLISGLNQALRHQPVAVSMSGVSYKLWSSAVPAYRTAGVPLIPIAIDDAPVDSTIAASVSSAAYFKKQGGLLGQWFIADSQATQDALIVGLPYFPPVADTAVGMREVIAKGCSECKVHQVDLTVPDLTNNRVPGVIASELRKNRGIKYVLGSSCNLIAGITTQLNAAGLTNIKVGCVGGSLASYAEIKTGTMQMITGQGSIQQGWLAADVAIRHVAGTPVDAGVEAGPPTQLINKSNLGTPSESWDVPKDYVQQFAKLWRVG